MSYTSHSLKTKDTSIKVIFKNRRVNSAFESWKGQNGAQIAQTWRIIEARSAENAGVLLRRMDLGVRRLDSNLSFTNHQLFCSLLISPDQQFYL